MASIADAARSELAAHPNASPWIVHALRSIAARGDDLELELERVLLALREEEERSGEAREAKP